MAGLYVAADLGALGNAAGHLSSGASGGTSGGALPSFGHAGADGSVADFARAAGRHAESLARIAADGAHVLHGYAIAFKQVGD